MKVYAAVKYKPFEEEQLVGIAKTKKGVMKILRREFPYMRGSLAENNLVSDNKMRFFYLTLENFNWKKNPKQ